MSELTLEKDAIIEKAHTPHDGRGVLYVVGLLFRPSGTEVVLIEKDRPERLCGLFNGLGGKVNVGETPAEAMPREFAEESGATVTNWLPFAVLRRPDDLWSIVIFKSFGNADVRTIESEKVAWFPVENVSRLPVVSHLHTLIAVALRKDATLIITDPR